MAVNERQVIARWLYEELQDLGSWDRAPRRQQDFWLSQAGLLLGALRKARGYDEDGSHD